MLGEAQATGQVKALYLTMLVLPQGSTALGVVGPSMATNSPLPHEVASRRC